MSLNLVTGGSGLLGNNVVRALLRREQPVRVLLRHQSDPGPFVGLDVELVLGDIRNAEAVGAAVEGVDRVFHCAGLVRIGRTASGALRSVNVTGTRLVAEACRASGARMVHVSSVDTLGFGTQSRPADERTSPAPGIKAHYVESKRQAEAVVLDAAQEGLDAVVVNPAFCLGPWDWRLSSGRILLAVARGEGRIAPPGGNDFCHVRDVARGILAAADEGRAGERYILGGEPMTYRTAFQIMAEVTGGPPVLFTAPAWAVKLAGRLGDLTTLILNEEPVLNSASAQLACLPHHFTSRKAEDELGYTNRGAEAAIRDAWRWFKKRRWV